MSKWIKNIQNPNSGIWLGDGISSQSVILCSTQRNIVGSIKDDTGFVITDGNVELVKLIYFENDNI